MRQCFCDDAPRRLRSTQRSKPQQPPQVPAVSHAKLKPRSGNLGENELGQEEHPPYREVSASFSFSLYAKHKLKNL